MADTDNIPDFELPPLDSRYDDIPITEESLIILDGDKEDNSAAPESGIAVPLPDIADMDNSPVAPPPKGDYKGAGRRAHLARERAMENYLKKAKGKKEDQTAYERSLDFFYERAEEERKMARTGFSLALTAGSLFMLLLVPFLIFNFGGSAFIITVAELLLAWTFIRSSMLGRRAVMAACLINIGVCLKNIYEMYDFGYAFTNAVFKGSRFLLTVNVLLVCCFAAALAVIRLSKSIYQYCLREVGMTEEYNNEDEL